MSDTDMVFEGSCNCGSWKAGADLLIRGDGISCGSTPRRITIKTANTRPRNSTKGIRRYLFMLLNGRRCSSSGHFHSLRLLDGLRDYLLLRERVTPIADSEESADCHQQSTAPNP